MIAPEPFFAPRGTPLSVYYRAKALSELGHEIDLLTYPIGKDVEIEKVKIFRSHRIPFVYDVEIGPSVTKLLLDLPLFLKALYLLLRNKYEIIHAHEEAVFFCSILNRLFGVKYIYDMHSSLPQQLENFNFTKFKPLMKLFEFLERGSLARACAIITICKELEDQVERSGFSDKNELIQNTLFFPIEFKDDSYDVDLGNIIRTKGKKVILYAGSFEPYQGLEMYLESIAIILGRRKDLLFIFLGGTSEQVLEMRSKAEELRVSDQTIFTGRLDVNLVKNFIHKADVLVSPRLKGTNTPLKIYEYMASEVPIVATNLKTHTQELDDECSFLQNPDPDDFAKGILECLENKGEARRRAINAHEAYCSKYGEAEYKRRLERIIARVHV
ncbi:MAG: glycosyltransferase [Planctomycetota bacterium]